ncbi:radical SAM protein [Cupriavidus sp. amp6]|uniref:radical SAM protein n=1 Tax=Cupriavidus sp. amp6 TaxID=388051 RepID=UPI00040D9E03|nr:radical SAM protein [Cupriavidus sp. amp6]
MSKAALDSLNDVDVRYPLPRVYDFLARSENSEFLDYVFKDTFGCHVFPGDIQNYPYYSFLDDMSREISKAKQIHLWSYIPTCRYRCHFCAFPTVILNPQIDSAQAVFRDVVDSNIAEARHWLESIPSLRRAEVGEFNIFGGTPSLLPQRELRCLVDFYQHHFNLSTASMRFEGEPGTLTKEYLSFLKSIGFSKISFGVQSFNEHIIKASGRAHSARACMETVHDAREVGFNWISVDLIYGLLGQNVDDVKRDMEKVLELELSHVVCTKLHIGEFISRRTGVSGERQSLWQKGRIFSNRGGFPGLGKQYQMRELVEQYLSCDYLEHPTMYFHRRNRPPEKWKGLVTDLGKQYPEVAIGLGGSSKCITAEAINITGYSRYKEALGKHRLPIEESRGISRAHGEINAFKMALSTLVPVNDDVFKERFEGRSFFANAKINRALNMLVRKALVTVDDNIVTLTPNGVTLVEAVINTQFGA